MDFGCSTSVTRTMAGAATLWSTKEVAICPALERLAWAETIYTQKYIKTSANTKHDNCMAFGPKTLIMLFTVTKVCSMFARQSETENCVTIHSIRSEETRFNTMCTA